MPPRARFEPTIPVFEQAKIFLALDRAATVVCVSLSCHYFKESSNCFFFFFASYARSREDVWGRGGAAPSC
jgi:hypothetical protein